MVGEISGFMLYIDAKPSYVLDTLDSAKRQAAAEIASGREVEIQTTSGRTLFWYYDLVDKVWVSAQHSRW